MNRLIHIVMAALILSLLLTGVVSCGTPDLAVPPRAAIIDQLESLYPNEEFIEETTLLLEAAGMEVDVFSGDKVTIDFYRDIATMGYKFLVFRVHSGLLNGSAEKEQLTWLFTNETYDVNTHVIEQLLNRVSRARTSLEAPAHFAVSSKFVADSMNGDFNGAVIVMMGCDSMHLPDMADAFISKGACCCIGWHRSVTLDYVDDATPFLVESLVVNDVPIVEALLETMQVKGPHPELGAILKYYPEISGNQTLGQLFEQ